VVVPIGASDVKKANFTQVWALLLVFAEVSVAVSLLLFLKDSYLLPLPIVKQ